MFVYFRTIILIALFSQYLSKVEIPVPGYKKERGGLYVGRFPLFRLFPVSTGTHSVTSSINSSLKSQCHPRRSSRRGIFFINENYHYLKYFEMWPGSPCVSSSLVFHRCYLLPEIVSVDRFFLKQDLTPSKQKHSAQNVLSVTGPLK